MIDPMPLIARFGRVEFTTKQREIFRFELNYCQASRKYFLSCLLGTNTVGHLDFSAEKDGSWITITNACFYLSTAENWSEYAYSSSDPALEVKPAFQRRNIAHAMFSVLASWGKQQGFAGILVPEHFAQPLRGLKNLGFTLTGGSYRFDLKTQISPPFFIK
ncbi:MAG: hypothetical protein PHH60_02170 [Candidatus Margulisbacteria bacterium]|nr:hypothetical protein [Candidatus Margulisiibacteriota bacterium]